MATKHRNSAAAAATAAASAVLEPKAQREELMAELTDSEIATRAYSYWESRGFQGGSPEDDWYRAKLELTEERGRGH
jgi:hypothetical protein